ncbi:hypothetical protein [Nocardia heshunensis]
MAGIFEAVVASSSAVSVALIGGAFAIRNARKTPHENLKSLLELLKDPDIHAGDRNVLDKAVHREISRIGLLNDARIQGFWAYQRARYLGSMSSYTQRALYTAIVLPPLSILTTWAWPVQHSDFRPPQLADPPAVGLKGNFPDAIKLNDYEMEMPYRWRLGSDWSPQYLFHKYTGLLDYHPWWLAGTAYAAIILVLVLVARVAKAAARISLLSAWANFAAILLPAQIITYVIYRSAGQLTSQPIAWYYYVYSGPCEGALDSRRLETAPGQSPKYECIQVGTSRFDTFHLIGDTWVQPAAQLAMPVFLVTVVILLSLLIRYGPIALRVRRRWIRPRDWLRRFRGAPPPAAPAP